METGTRESSINPLDLLVDGQLTLPMVAHTGEGVVRSLLGCAGVLHMSQLTGDLHNNIKGDSGRGWLVPTFSYSGGRGLLLPVSVRLGHNMTLNGIVPSTGVIAASAVL